MSDPRVNQQPEAPDRVFSGVLEPGNGGRYEYLVWRTSDGQWYAAFPDFQASNRIGAGQNNADYIQSKMRCSYPDAEVMAAIINRCIMTTSAGTMEDFLQQVRNG